MISTSRLTTLVLAALLVAGTTAPAAATAGSGASRLTESVATGLAAADGTNNSSVNVTVGQQLSTVVTATSDEVQTDFENTAFEVNFEGANESERAEAVAERAETLRERAERINEDYRDATTAYRSGELTESEYAQRIAVLNTRAENVRGSYERLQERAENVSTPDLREAGINGTTLNGSVESLDAVTGSGPSAILERFTGQTEGELDIEADDGLTVEVESEDGERSVEVRRSRDDDETMTVDRSAALSTAREELPAAPGNGSWTLTEGSVHAESGYYKFEFSLRGANASGESEVRVDGSSGTVFRLEQEVEHRERDEQSDRGNDERGNESERDGELSLVVAGGTPAPNATITVKAVSEGEPVPNATVYVGDSAAGTTDDAGTVSVTLPEGGATVKAVRGDREAELEFEFAGREDNGSRRLDVSGSIDNGTVTISVSADGASVSGATVYADGDRVGTTAADGTVSFATDATEELAVEVVKGESEAEVTLAVSGDSMSPSGESDEGDGDEAETDGEDDETTSEEDEADDEDETTTVDD
ncbi:DUF7096 domain-containing protein [Halorussus sp. AFM4]|uniref:DUF7096 domain-containing protein n=1 Tax=Halorussus sp. AFM4 TaxID=3421651 RepID=UPI003EB9F402